MATKMAVNLKIYKTFYPETDKVQEFACKIPFFLLILELLTSSLYHPSDATHASLFKIAFRMVADKFYKYSK